MHGIPVNSGLDRRKNYIDFTKGVTMLTVVLCHLVPFRGPVFNWVLAFNMPIFFLIQGFMQKETLPPFAEFIKKKVVRLLVPGWIYRLLCFIIVPAIFGEAVFTVKSVLFIIFWHPKEEWFLPVMFWVSIGMYIYILLRNRANNERIFVFLSVIFIALIDLFRTLYMRFHENLYIPFKLDSAVLALTFAIIGYWIKKASVLDFCMKRYGTISKKPVRIAVLSGALGIFSIFAFGNTINSYVNMADNSVGYSVLTYYAAGTLMFLILMTIGANLKKEGIIVRWLYLLGRHSLFIYMGHMFINTVIVEMVKLLTNGRLVLVPMFNLSYAWMAGFFVVAMSVLTILCLALEKWRQIKLAGKD